MRHVIFLSVILFALLSCRKDKIIEGQGITISFQTKAWQDNHKNTIITSLNLFAVDRDNRIIRHETYSSEEIHDGEIHALLPLGRYRLAIIANASDQSNITIETGETLENIFLHLPPSGDADEFLTALQSISITESKTTIPPIKLSRRVGKLKVTLDNIPEEVSNAHLELSFASSSINFTGSKTNTSATITKPLDEHGQAELLTFPMKKGESTLSITYHVDNTSKRRIIPFTETIDTNKTTSVNHDFQDLPEGNIQGNGENLLQNGDFESWSDPEKEPDHWHFYKDGKDSIVTKLTGKKVLNGKQAAYLQGKTYLYQDIEIEAGKRYEIKMHVNAPSPSFPWKYYCYWRKNKSTALPAENNKPIQSQKYQQETNGWSKAFHGIFTAPEGANLLRVEIRTYGKEITVEEGIGIDDFSVELVE